MSKNSDCRNPQSMAQELQTLLLPQYPDLTASCVEKKLYIRGSFPVTYEGKVLDRYQIEIEWSDSDKEIPLLRETDGRIPWIAGRHMSVGGLACVCVPEEWLIRPREERTVTRYLDGPVRNYFIWQSLKERGQASLWKDRAHGVSGLIDAYGDIVGFRNESAIRRCLEYLSKKKIKPHWPCPCGSGQQIRGCHHALIRGLQTRIPRRIVKLALKRLADPRIR